MVGILELPVPLFSAIKKDGKRLYKHAYRGNPENIVPPKREMKIHSSTYQGLTKTEHNVYVHVLFSVASGVYIRSLVEEFGRRIGMPATVDQLRRISVGTFLIKDARSLNDLAFYR
jgi:tRNA pseudouridine55 synthase